MLIFNQFTRRRPNLASWLLSIVLLAGAGTAIALWHSHESNRLLAAETERLNALSKILVKDITVNLIAIDRALSGVIRDRLGDGDAFDAAVVSQRLRALVEAMPGVRGMVVMNTAGKVMAGIPADLTGRDFSQRAYFSVPRARGDAALLYLSPPFRSIRGDIVMNATRVIPSALRFNGVVSAVLDPEYFSGILRVALYATDMRATITHSDGTGFVAAGAGVASAPHLSGRALIAPAGLHADSALSLELRRDTATVLAPLTRQTQTLGAVCVAAALAWAAMLSWYQARRQRFLQAENDRERARIDAEALRASEARFRTLIEEAPVAIAMARHGRFIYTNRRYNQLHGYAATEDLTGLTWSDMIAPDSLSSLHQQLTSIDADAAVEQRFEAIGLGNGGAPIPVFKATTRVQLGDGAATLIFVQDISAQKSAESHLLEARDAAQAANRSKAEFLANMSHEIRTPLNAILGMAYLLERGNRDREAAVMLQKIRLAGRSLLGIINDILDVSKIEAGAMVLERSWFNLQDVFDSVAATMGVAVGDKAIVLRVAPLPTLAACVMGDALRIEQLLVNLTSNAIKFTEKGSVSLTVEASLRADGKAMLTFRVSDSGIGISAAQQASIFAPFTQADSSTTRRYGGSGLGLTICKQMVELMGGQIGVDSVPGCGSTFWFSLTVPVKPAANGSSSPDMMGLQVIIAEADDPDRSTVPETARALGWQVCHAASGAEVLDHISQRAGSDLPGAVILDWQLTGADCMTTARAIRASVPADRCPVVIMISTFLASAVEAEQARTVADAMLTTPVTTSSLFNAVLEARGRRSTADQRLRAPVPAGVALSGLRLLVVDDSEINRDVAQRILETEGAQVALAEHGRAAIDYLLANPDRVDLVLMDVQMPVMDGIEATTILRGMARFVDLPIVALTAGAFNSHQEAARQAGMNHFIAKPFDVAATVNLISSLTAGRGGADVVLAAPPLPLLPPLHSPLAPAYDVALGVRTWGDLPTLHRYLHKFADSFSPAIATIRSGLDDGARTVAAGAAHKLAGAASGVALTSVAAHATRLERLLTCTPARPADEALAVDQLAVAMQAALDDIARLSAPSVATVEALPADPEMLVGLFEKLILALEESNPEPPLQAVDRLARHVPLSQLAPIRACIDDFDWGGATTCARALARQLQLTLANDR